jgi:hypothetical protein
MASTSSGRLYSLEDVVAEMMEVPGVDVDHDEELSDVVFEGYIDDDNEQCQRETEMNATDLDIGGECEVGEPDPSLEIPKYSFYLVVILHALMQPLWSSSRCC